MNGGTQSKKKNMARIYEKGYGSETSFLLISSARDDLVKVL